jgi:predicted nicotinamide N-methyase
MDLDLLFTNTDYATITITIPCHRRGTKEVDQSVAPSVIENNVGFESTLSSSNGDRVTDVTIGNANDNNDNNNQESVVHQEELTASITLDVDCSQAASTDYDLTGQILWPVSVLLSHYVASERGSSLVRGRTVVELGAGCGLPGMVAAHFADRVLLTDGNDVVMDLLARNASKDVSGTLTTSTFLWGRQDDLVRILGELNGNVDVVIAADVVQWPAVVEPLLHTVKALLWESRAQQPTFVLGIVNRAQTTYDLFFKLAKELGFSWIQVAAEDFLKDGLIPKSCQEFGGRSTELFEIELIDRSVEPVLHDKTQDLTLGKNFENTPFLPC